MNKTHWSCDDNVSNDDDDEEEEEEDNDDDNNNRQMQTTKNKQVNTNAGVFYKRKCLSWYW